MLAKKISDKRVADLVSDTGAVNGVFDNGFLSSEPYLLSVEENYTKNAGIPSSRFYYFSKIFDPTTGSLIKIPCFALPYGGNLDQPVRDYGSHSSSEENFYRRKSSVNRLDGPVILTELLAGRTNSEWTKTSYLRTILNTIKDNVSNGIYRGDFTPNDVLKMVQYPINPAANFAEATELVDINDSGQIQAYLNNIGVDHFKADDIENLPRESKLFWLTRFYGAYTNDYKQLSFERYYYSLCKHPIARRFVKSIQGSALITEYSPIIINIIQGLNVDRKVDKVMTSILGITNPERFLNSVLDYFPLFSRKFLGPLTLGSLRGKSQEELRDLLKSYTDVEVVQVLGDFPGQTRNAFINLAVQKILTPGTFLMTKADAALCRNSQSISLDYFSEYKTAYIGRGSLSEGFNCYDIAELVDGFEATKSLDGHYTFMDPVVQERNFTINDLKQISELFRTISPSIYSAFQKYVQIATIQKEADLAVVADFRAWVNQSPDNRNIMRDFWMAYFRMGMYMRQWKGPGHPYPISKNETGVEQDEGTAGEINIVTNVSIEKGEFVVLLEKLPVDLREKFWKLPVYYFANDTIEPLKMDTTILGRYTNVIDKGDFCIRIASGPWTYTAAYYMMQILDEAIPGFDITVPPVGIQ